MLNLIGEYDCKLDAKGRMMLPKGIQKQLKKKLDKGLVLNRHMFNKCVVIFPWETWEKESAKINKLNKYKRKNDDFIRQFNAGTSHQIPDAQGRILVPAALKKFAAANKEVTLISLNDRIELWAKDGYEKKLEDKTDLGDLAEDVMGDIEPDFD